jgi:hypothetical protein
MRSVLDHSITAWILVSMIAAPGVSGAQDDLALAVRGEGYLGYSKLEIDGSLIDFDGDGLDGGAAGSVSAIVESFYLQGDVLGDFSHFDNFDPERVAGVGHLGWRDAALGSFGIVGAINHSDENGSSTDEWRTGIEAQAFVRRFTLGLDAGYFDGNASSNANGNELVYLRGRVAFYPLERIRLDLKGGALGVGKKDDPIALLGAGAEFLVLDSLSAFVRWETSFVDDGGTDIDEHSVVGGVRLYWGSEQPSLESYDRERFNESCLGIRTFGRSC